MYTISQVPTCNISIGILRFINIILLIISTYKCIFCRNSGKSWLSSIVMWGIIAVIAYYIYQRLTYNPAEQYPCMIMSLSVKNDHSIVLGVKPNLKYLKIRIINWSLKTFLKEFAKLKILKWKILLRSLWRLKAAMNDKIFEDLLANRFSIISFRILGRFPAGNHIVAFIQYIKDMCEGNSQAFW